MTWLLVSLPLLLLIAAVVFLAMNSRRTTAPAGSYRAIKPLSEPEQTLYWRLKEAMPECVVLSQVTFSRFLAPQTDDRGHRQALFNRISRKSADFLVCLPDFTVVSAVELDDRTHSKDVDAARDAILESAGVPIVRVHVREIPPVDRLREMFTK